MNEHQNMNIKPEYKFKNKKIENIWSIFSVLSDTSSFVYSTGNKGGYSVSCETMMSILNTLTSIDFCCCIKGFSDAYTLIRKYRDDLMQYLFILYVTKNLHCLNDEEFKACPLDADSIKKMREAYYNYLKSNERKNEDHLAMEAWMYNDLDKAINKKYRKEYFGASKYKKYLMSKDKRIDYLMKKILDPLWKNSDRILNNYVHANGKKYLTDNFRCYEPIKRMSELIELLQNITIIFISLLAIIDSTIMMSSDYIDFLDMNEQPPEGCQYYVCPCIQEYMNKNLSKDLLSYLQDNENHGMQFISK